MPQADHVLIVDDDPDIRQLLAEYLTEAGFRTSLAASGREMRKRLEEGIVDLVILDLMLPGEDGLTLCREFRTYSNTPVIMLTAKGTLIDRIIGLEMGADDYLPKPFSMAELQVRVEAILRRVAMERLRVQPREDVVQQGELQFCERSADVSVNGQPAGLTPSEYRLLDTLHRQREEVLSKPFLYQHVLQRGYSQHDRSLDMHVSQIRRKLKALGYQRQQLRTVWGKGYLFGGGEA